jgi:histone acetyltransferase (RNA polymerase elongator complex component)
MMPIRNSAFHPSGTQGGTAFKYKILPFFLPHYGCPHHCVFCDQGTITGSSPRISIEKIRSDIEAFASSPLPPAAYPIRKEVAFYGSSFSAMPRDIQEAVLDPARQALDRGGIHGIRISTRPDACDASAIRLLKEYRVETVEVGVQSFDPEVLRRSGRGHGPEESSTAVKTLLDEGFVTGVQLMPGLPGEDRASFDATIRRVLSLKPHIVRLYPVLVLKGTPLESLYETGAYVPLSLDQAVELCRDAAIMLRESGIRVIRCGLHPSASLMREGVICAGPFHPAFGELVESAVAFECICDAIKGISASNGIMESLSIRSGPRLFSILRGHKGGNLLRLQSLYPKAAIRFTQDAALPDHIISIRTGSGRGKEITYPDPC